MAQDKLKEELNTPEVTELEEPIDGLDTADEEIAPGEIRTKTNPAFDIFDFFEMLILAACAIMLLFSFVARVCTVDGPSMNETLEHGDKIIVSDLFYTPKQGDIVVFQELDIVNPRTNEPYGAIIKRVIATGGQTVVLQYNTQGNETTVTITVDGKLIDEPYRHYTQLIGADKEKYMGTPQVFTVPAGSLFVMGDNTYNSEDSRGLFEYVKEDKVVGRAFFRISGADFSSIFDKFGFI